MKKLVISGAVAWGLIVGSASADIFFGTFDLTGSTADLTVTGAVSGSGSMTASSGSVSLFLEGSGGIFTSLLLTSGAAALGDTSFGVSGLTSTTVSTSGFGFSFAQSTFTLNHTGGGVYEIGGGLSLEADTGTVSGAGLATLDFLANPVAVSPTLLNTSLITIIDANPSDGLLNVSGDLKFGGVSVGSFSSGPITANVDLSSSNTISFGGGMVAVPEPGTVSLFLFGLLGLSVWRTKRQASC